MNRARSPIRSIRGPGRGPMIPGEKAKNFGPTVKRLAKYFSSARKAIIFAFIITVLATISGTASPKILGNATTSIQTTILQRNVYDEIERAIGDIPENAAADEIYASLPDDMRAKMPENTKAALMKLDFSAGRPEIDYSYILMVILICGGLYATGAVFNFLQAFIMVGIAQKTVYKMRNDVSEKLNRLPMSFFDKHTHGEILSRVTNDIDNISNTMQQALSQLITSAVTVVTVLILMISINLIMTLICVLTLPVIVVITMFVAKRSQKEFSANQRELGHINGHIEEMYTGKKIISAFSHETESIAEFDRINARLYRAGWRSQFISGSIMPLTNFINNIGYLLICVIGGLLSTGGQLALGDIVACTQYSRRFTQPIVQISNIFNTLQSTAASAERVFEILDEPEQIPDAEDAVDMKQPKGEVIFDNIKFGYDPAKPLIRGLSINVRPGQTVAIVGPTGAGKTTLVNLLMRFYEVSGGRITIDGTDITDIRRDSLHDIFGMVLQDTWLFGGSIRDNIAYGREGCTEEQIIAAAKAAYVDNFVRTMSDGYDTVINEDASNISQGQKQLITIARAVLADPAILILDEATSSVDTRTEVLIQKAMNRLMANRTSFVIAHRLSTIRSADVILVMNHGDIIEQGTHEELMAAKGFYADLYNSQFTEASAI